MVDGRASSSSRLPSCAEGPRRRAFRRGVWGEPHDDQTRGLVQLAVMHLFRHTEVQCRMRPFGVVEPNTLRDGFASLSLGRKLFPQPVLIFEDAIHSFGQCVLRTVVAL